MVHDSEETEVVEEAVAEKPKISIVILLSVLLGILLTLVAIGSVLFYQRSKDLQAEVLAVKMELKEKALVQGELQGQIEALSRQMAALKEYSIARSSSPRVKEVKPDPSVDTVQPVVKSPAETGQATVTGSVSEPVPILPTPVPPKVKRPKPEGQSCELVGKSAEQQAATLKRCVGLMDTPKEKTGAK